MILAILILNALTLLVSILTLVSIWLVTEPKEDPYEDGAENS